MKNDKIAVVIGVLSFPLLGCNSQSDTTTTSASGGETGAEKSVFYDAQVLACYYQDGNVNHLERFCITTGFCTVTPEVLFLQHRRK